MVSLKSETDLLEDGPLDHLSNDEGLEHSDKSGNNNIFLNGIVKKTDFIIL